MTAIAIAGTRKAQILAQANSDVAVQTLQGQTPDEAAAAVATATTIPQLRAQVAALTKLVLALREQL